MTFNDTTRHKPGGSVATTNEAFLIVEQHEVSRTYHTHTHTHTRIHVYIYMHMYVCINICKYELCCVQKEYRVGGVCQQTIL